MKKLWFIIVLVAAMCTQSIAFPQGKVTRRSKQQSQRVKPKKATPKVMVSKPDGYIDGVGYVNLGLPSGTKWATCNIGATRPNEFGNYFSWGERQHKSNYSEANYIINNYSTEDLMIWGIIDENGILSQGYDAATFNIGNRWTIPTKDNYYELVKYCTWTRHTVDGVDGYVIKSGNGKTIFLPLTGSWSEQYNQYSTHYWSSSYNAGVPFFLYLGCDRINNSYFVGSGLARYCGCAIRPILKAT